ncbi:MAG: AAA family ATPase [Acidobacteria bacterium]|nr:AAA family ATPase [Acidobacteriota bacterium]
MDNNNYSEKGNSRQAIEDLVPAKEELNWGQRDPLPPDSLAMQMADEEVKRTFEEEYLKFKLEGETEEGAGIYASPPDKPADTHTTSNNSGDKDRVIRETLGRIVPASAIMATTYPQPKFAVQGIIPEGVTFLAGPPKLGKSIMALNIAVAVAEGGRALSSYDVDQGDVLYLALEDSERRIQTRLRSIISGSISPHLEICTQWPRLNEGGIEAIAAWIESRKDPRLLIIDTLKMLRPISTGRENNVYESDYDVIAPLTRLAAQKLALVIVHHTRKAIADDPLATVSGSYGLTGAADGVLVLKRARGKADATMSVIGRDVEEQDIALKFEPKSFHWSALGQAAEVQRSRERQDIIDLFGNGKMWKPIEIADELDRKAGTVRKLLKAMKDAGEIEEFHGGYQLPNYEPPAPPKSQKSNSVTGVTSAGNGSGNALEGSKPKNLNSLQKSVTGVTTVTAPHTRRAEV